MTPKLIRMRDAPAYLGMSLRVFNQTVRPNVREVVVGIQGVAFIRDELDQWAEDFFELYGVAKPALSTQNGRRIERCHEERKSTWHEKQSQASTRKMVSGTLINSSEVSGFEKVRALLRERKQNSI